jgi:hypothetical protein
MMMLVVVMLTMMMMMPGFAELMMDRFPIYSIFPKANPEKMNQLRD